VSFVGCQNRLDSLSNHIAYDLRNKTIRVAHPIEVWLPTQKELLNSRCPHQWWTRLLFWKIAEARWNTSVSKSTRTSRIAVPSSALELHLPDQFCEPFNCSSTNNDLKQWDRAMQPHNDKWASVPTISRPQLLEIRRCEGLRMVRMQHPTWKPGSVSTVKK
jgi:hypothetical protein